METLVQCPQELAGGEDGQQQQHQTNPECTVGTSSQPKTGVTVENGLDGCGCCD